MLFANFVQIKLTLALPHQVRPILYTYDRYCEFETVYS
jgi:hypothetical protein